MTLDDFTPEERIRELDVGICSSFMLTMKTGNISPDIMVLAIQGALIRFALLSDPACLDSSSLPYVMRLIVLKDSLNRSLDDILDRVKTKTPALYEEAKKITKARNKMALMMMSDKSVQDAFYKRHLNDDELREFMIIKVMEVEKNLKNKKEEKI